MEVIMKITFFHTDLNNSPKQRGIDIKNAFDSDSKKVESDAKPEVPKNTSKYDTPAAEWKLIESNKSYVTVSVGIRSKITSDVVNYKIPTTPNKVYRLVYFPNIKTKNKRAVLVDLDEFPDDLAGYGPAVLAKEFYGFARVIVTNDEMVIAAYSAVNQLNGAKNIVHKPRGQWLKHLKSYSRNVESALNNVSKKVIP